MVPLLASGEQLATDNAATNITTRATHRTPYGRSMSGQYSSAATVTNCLPEASRVDRSLRSRRWAMPSLRAIALAGLAVGLLALLAGVVAAGGSALVAGDWWLARQPWIGIGLTLVVVGLAMTGLFAMLQEAIAPLGWLRLLALPPALIVALMWAFLIPWSASRRRAGARASGRCSTRFRSCSLRHSSPRSSSRCRLSWRASAARSRLPLVDASEPSPASTRIHDMSAGATRVAMSGLAGTTRFRASRSPTP